ncbi:MAG: hypothetical protein ACYDA8_01345 [Deferrisomatales bacterium]
MPQYVTDERGERVGVILPLAVYEQLLEDLDDLAVVAERRDEPTVGHGDVVEKLKRDGLL